MTEAKKILIRFNTKHDQSNLTWRVFEDGVENLASDIRIETHAWSESSFEGNIKKWNIACLGKAFWDGTTVIIK